MDIDRYRNNDIYLAGKGIVGLMGDTPSESFHFFCDVPRVVYDTHNHTRSFRSTVLKGHIRNHLFEIRKIPRPKGQHLVNIECEQICGIGGCRPHKVVSRCIELVKIGEMNTRVGETYLMSHEVFHRLEFPAGPTITHLHWKPMEKKETQIVVEQDYLTNKCEEPTATEDELWEMVESCLKNDNLSS